MKCPRLLAIEGYQNKHGQAYREPGLHPPRPGFHLHAETVVRFWHKADQRSQPSDVRL
jgi:hypothetical protein